MRRPWLGARLQAVTSEIADSLGLARPTGALVSNVAPGSPAARAGLRLSDLITGIDGQTVEDPNAFDYRFATRPLGGNAQIDIVRAGKPQKLTIALKISQRLYVMGHGRIVFEGTPAELGADAAIRKEWLEV